MDTAIILAILCIPLYFAVRAAYLLPGAQVSSRWQKGAQFLLAWLVPIIGPLIVMAVHRPKEKAPGEYPNDENTVYISGVRFGISTRPHSSFEQPPSSLPVAE